MNPRQFLDTIVRPNVAEFRENFGDLRHAHNAVASLDALAAHVFAWALEHVPDAVSPAKDDSAFRKMLADRNRHFALLRDVAKAQKHVLLTRGKPRVARAIQVTARETGWGVGRWGEGRWGGVEQVVVNLGGEDFEYLETVIDEALAFL